jgi:hypothetical protein
MLKKEQAKPFGLGSGVTVGCRADTTGNTLSPHYSVVEPVASNRERPVDFDRNGDRS